MATGAAGSMHDRRITFALKTSPSPFYSSPTKQRSLKRKNFRNESFNGNRLLLVRISFFSHLGIEKEEAKLLAGGRSHRRR